MTRWRFQSKLKSSPNRGGRCPSPLTKAAVQVTYHVNVGNLRDTGHSTQPTPTAAKADKETVVTIVINFRLWPSTALNSWHAMIALRFIWHK
jgi:hypothetical protein